MPRASALGRNSMAATCSNRRDESGTVTLARKPGNATSARASAATTPRPQPRASWPGSTGPVGHQRSPAAGSSPGSSAIPVQMSKCQSGLDGERWYRPPPALRAPRSSRSRRTVLSVMVSPVVSRHFSTRSATPTGPASSWLRIHGTRSWTFGHSDTPLRRTSRCRNWSFIRRYSVARTTSSPLAARAGLGDAWLSLLDVAPERATPQGP